MDWWFNSWIWFLNKKIYMKYNRLFAIISILIIVLIGIYFILNKEVNELNNNEREKLGGTFIKLSDGYTHYNLSGKENDKLIVLVHGGTIPMFTWTRQVNVLNNAGYKVLIYDKYGRGFSDRPDVVYNQELYKRQLFELVNKLGFTKQFDLVGLSVGGGTAINFTAEYPKKVHKLILISPLINNFKLPFILKIPVIGEFIARIVGIKIITKRFLSLIKDSPNEKKYKELFIKQTTYKGFQRSLLSMLRYDAVKDYTKAYKIVGKQKREILLIWGENDTEITKGMIDDIRTLLPNVNFKPIENSGHGVVFNKYKIVNDLMIKFLE